MEHTQYSTKYISPIGTLTISAMNNKITGLWIENQKYDQSTLGEHVQKDSLPLFEEVKQWLNHYFNGEKPEIKFPIEPVKNSSFRHLVWNILSSIPYGQVTTYGKIAKQLEKELRGQRVSAQAVGGAVGHNPISILVPCHRVIGTDGKLTGYAGGIDKKRYLLKLENIRLEGDLVCMKDHFMKNN
ncbi:methylated-DNA--protein-cysteine methyltransferase [Clostridia bacterium]|nr:methylated-DNA--protein-cysteine methyltransferase [Clostridia bacterium]